MTLYAVNYHCPRCGKVHPVTSGLVLAHDSGQRGTVAQLWPKGNYPPALTGLLGDLVWCDQAGEYVPMDPERLTVIPPGGA